MVKHTLIVTAALVGVAMAAGPASAGGNNGLEVPSGHGDPSFQCHQVAGRVVCVAALQPGCTLGLVYAGSGTCYVEGQGQGAAHHAA